MPVLKRKDTWYIVYDLPRLLNGKRRQKWVSCPGANKAQAEQQLRDALTALHRGAYSEPSSQSVAQYLNSWLERRRPDLSPTTVEAYEKNIRNHILPALGTCKLSKVRPMAVQQMYDSLLKHLSPKTVRNIHGILSNAFTQAVRLQIIPTNPLDAVTPPRVKDAEVETIPIERIAVLLEAVQASKYRLPVLIILGTGMRRGEALGLKWTDFDSARKTLTVRRSIAQVTGRVFAKPPKTPDSVRVVAVTESLANDLLETKKHALSEWICANPDGSHMTPQGLSGTFQDLMAAAGVKATLRALRHTQATMLIMAGVPVKVVSERLGHSDVGTTLRIYTHVLPHMQDQAAEVLARLLSSC